jgi:uncharacterized protein YjaZ
MTHGIELVIGNAPRMHPVVHAIAEPFREASAVCQTRLHADDIEVHVMDAPGETIPEWGLGGYTYGPHSVLIAVDPERLLDPLDVLSTLVHEIHHVVRWRAQGPASSLRERLIEEGLAEVFEEEVTGRRPFYSEGGVPQSQRGVASQHLDEEPANDGRWFFGSTDLPRWFGYRLGYEAVRAAVGSLGLDAAALVAEPTPAFDRWLP